MERGELTPYSRWSRPGNAQAGGIWRRGTNAMATAKAAGEADYGVPRKRFRGDFQT